ncbi:hypothetical protein AB1N83_005764 [Pleurotus pulmonarius]
MFMELQIPRTSTLPQIPVAHGGRITCLATRNRRDPVLMVQIGLLPRLATVAQAGSRDSQLWPGSTSTKVGQEIDGRDCIAGFLLSSVRAANRFISLNGWV